LAGVKKRSRCTQKRHRFYSEFW